MPPPPRGRSLVFTDFEDVIREAESLLSSGSTAVGQWDLTRTCDHLAIWLSYPVVGYPSPPLPARLLLGAARLTVGPRILRQTLATGAMTPGSPTVPASVPAEGGDPRAAVMHLRAAIDQFRTHPGPYHPSPLFGNLDRATTTRLQLIHCAHHLGHLIPAS